MSRYGTLHVLGLGIAITALAQSGRADPCQPPAQWTAKYVLHETPSEPSSPVAFKIALRLAYEDTDCSAVGWRVTEIEIRQVHADLSETIWQHANPELNTADGLWWVDHADVSAPTAAEFVLPPELAGVASAVDPEDDDLSYELAGATYTPPEPPATPPYAITAALDYSFTLSGAGEPLVNGTHEPADVPVAPPS